MRSIKAVAFLLTFLILTPGCLTFFGEEESELVDCEMEPNDPTCESNLVTEEDCFYNEIFTGEYCRLMTSPKNLDYGEDSILLVVGQDMHCLLYTSPSPRDLSTSRMPSSA